MKVQANTKTNQKRLFFEQSKSNCDIYISFCLKQAKSTCQKYIWYLVKFRNYIISWNLDLMQSWNLFTEKFKHTKKWHLCFFNCLSDIILIVSYIIKYLVTLHSGIEHRLYWAKKILVLIFIFKCKLKTQFMLNATVPVVKVHLITWQPISSLYHKVRSVSLGENTVDDVFVLWTKELGCLPAATIYWYLYCCRRFLVENNYLNSQDYSISWPRETEYVDFSNLEFDR